MYEYTIAIVNGGRARQFVGCRKWRNGKQINSNVILVFYGIRSGAGFVTFTNGNSFLQVQRSVH